MFENCVDIDEYAMDHPLPKKVSQILSQMRPTSYEIAKAQYKLKAPRLMTNEIIDQIILKKN